jgi:uncharacterized membrane protein YqjE
MNHSSKRFDLSENHVPSLREGLVAAVNLYRTRFELFLLDIEEEKERLEQLLIMAGIAVFLFGLGALVVTGFFVALLWESIGIWALAIFAVLYLGVAGALAMVLRHRARNRPRTFACTLREFEKDADRFSRALDGEITPAHRVDQRVTE